MRTRLQPNMKEPIEKNDEVIYLDKNNDWNGL